MDGPASLRALSAWDDLGRVHGILPYGPEVTTKKLQGYNDLFQRGMFFSLFFQYLPEHLRRVTPLPTGSRNTTPLVLTESLAIPDAAQGERAYEVLVPMASWLGERRVLPATTAGWQFIKSPDRDHFDLVFPESTPGHGSTSTGQCQGFPRRQQPGNDQRPIQYCYVSFGTG